LAGAGSAAAFNPFAMFGMPPAQTGGAGAAAAGVNPFAAMAGGNMNMDPAALRQMLQNPMVRAGMQMFRSNPQMIASVCFGCHRDAGSLVLHRFTSLCLC